MSKIKRKMGSGFGSVGLCGEETEGQKQGARSRYAEEMPERARRWISPMGMPAIDIRELSDEMLIFMLQLMAPEKYGRPATPGGESESHHQLSVISHQSAAAKSVALGADAVQQRAEIRDQRSEKTAKIPESGRQIKSQAIYDEEVMSKKNVETQTPPPSSAVALLQRVDSTQCACGGKEAERMSQCNQSSVIRDPSAAGESVALGADAGSGDVRSEMPGSSEIPESPGDFVSQTAGDELLTSQECPEFVGGDDRRADGVKAVEDDRSPSPGGTAQRPELHEHPRGFRAAGGDLAGVSEIPESSLAFSAETADGKGVTNVEKPICPPVAAERGGCHPRSPGARTGGDGCVSRPDRAGRWVGMVDLGLRSSDSLQPRLSHGGLQPRK